MFEGRADVVDGEALSREQLDEAAKHDNVLAEAMHERKGRAFFEGFFLRFGQAEPVRAQLHQFQSAPERAERQPRRAVPRLL